ncbi:hypothetical protein HK102_013930 [Quaeritorhiza haematococci]|nr:hypothetical protein HK102_013930 [Quaeritorhiza haematococci]
MIVPSTKLVACIATVLLACASSDVEAHGKLENPQGLNVQVDKGVPLRSQKDVTRIRGNGQGGGDAPCGRFQNGRGQPLDLTGADMTPRMTVAAGSAAQVTWFQQNADGAGPLTASIDPTGTGTNFQPLKMAKNLPGRNGINQQNSGKGVDVAVNIPQGLQCTGPEGACLLRLQNPLGFVSCAPIAVEGGAAAGAAAEPAAAGAPKGNLRGANKQNKNKARNNQ